VNLTPFLAEIAIFTFACLALLVDLYREGKKALAPVFAYLGLLAALIATILLWSEKPIEIEGMFLTDGLSGLAKIFLYGCTAITFLYTHRFLNHRHLATGEFYALVLLSLLGMMIMVSSAHFLILYLGLEIMSLSLYALVALDRNNAKASEAAFKYFVLGALASGLLLYGLSIIYGLTGTLVGRELAMDINFSGFNLSILIVAAVFVVAAIAFKLGAVPFHAWIPDAYEGAPAAITLFLSTAPKIAAAVFALRILPFNLQDIIVIWQPVLVVLATLSLIIGNFAAIMQSNIKRMLGYSAISHIGFLLIGLLAGTEKGYSASLFYILAYAIMSLASFGMVIFLSDGKEADKIEDFKGLNSKNPFMAFGMLILMISLAGIPPTAGFYSKLFVLEAALDQGFVGLVVLAVLMSAVGAYYYLRVIKVMYFDEPLDGQAASQPRWFTSVLALNCLVILFLGIIPMPLLQWCQQAIVASLGQ
jgi:NADH-quinone oxidoreductase subunit N